MDNVETTEYEFWDPHAYLNTFFKGDESDDPTLRFIVEEMRKIHNNPKAIDVGTGPTCSYWMPITPNVSELYLSDYQKLNLQELNSWITDQPGHFDWQHYTKLLLEYEGLKTSDVQKIADRENEARAKVKACLQCDVRLPNPLDIEHRAQYGLVTSFYCADAASKIKSEWQSYMKNIFSLLKPGGFFIGGALYNTENYNTGERQYSNTKVIDSDVKNLMNECGFDTKSLRIEVAHDAFSDSVVNDPDRAGITYDKLILMSGFLKR